MNKVLDITDNTINTLPVMRSELVEQAKILMKKKIEKEGIRSMSISSMQLINAHMQEWSVREYGNKAYYLSGLGLGWSDEELAIGTFDFRADTEQIFPVSSESRELFKVIAAQCAVPSSLKIDETAFEAYIPNLNQEEFNEANLPDNKIHLLSLSHPSNIEANKDFEIQCHFASNLQKNIQIINAYYYWDWNGPAIIKLDYSSFATGDFVTSLKFYPGVYELECYVEYKIDGDEETKLSNVVSTIINVQ